MRGNVVDLAVAVVIGAAFGGVITAFVKDLLTPVISAFGGQPDFSNYSVVLNGSVFRYGDFVNSLLSFVIIAAAVYFVVVLPMSRLKKKPEAAAPELRECPECLSSIPAQAYRCAHCGQAVASVTRIPTAK